MVVRNFLLKLAGFSGGGGIYFLFSLFLIRSPPILFGYMRPSIDKVAWLCTGFCNLRNL